MTKEDLHKAIAEICGQGGLKARLANYLSRHIQEVAGELEEVHVLALDCQSIDAGAPTWIEFSEKTISEFEEEDQLIELIFCGGVGEPDFLEALKSFALACSRKAKERGLPLWLADDLKARIKREREALWRANL